MRQLELDTKLVIIAIGTFLIVYVFTFPLGWLVSDVYSYMNQGIAIANGDSILSYSDAVTKDVIPYNGTTYPLGNAFWIALWIKLCSLKYVYIGSLFSVIISSILIFKVLVKESLFKLAILLIFLYPSLAFFSNTLMSAIPSLLIISTFLYGLFAFRESGKKWLWLAFLAALSFWFRETNLVLLGSICLLHFIQDKRWFLYYAGGTILGFLPRVLSSYCYYNDPLHYVLAESFSIQNFVNNIGVYAILLLCFMPFGLFFLGKYRGRYRMPLIGSTSLFILMYFFYSFNSTIYSGFFKGIILMGRFMIPILPFFIISVGWHFRNKILDKNLKLIATVVICGLIIGLQVMIHREAKLHKSISNHIYSNYSEKLVLIDLSRTTNIVRYINPYHGNLSYMSDISNLGDDDFMKKLFSDNKEGYLIQTLNSVNAEKLKYTSKIDDLVKNAHQNYNVIEVENIKIKPALFLQVLKINQKDEKEK